MKPIPNRKQHLILAIAMLALALPALAEVSLAPVFQDHMVLQREMPVPVWGTANPGEAVKVSFQSQARETKAGKDGKWSVTLDPLTTSAQGLELTVQGENTLKLADVLVGEVWICSGQSNMEFMLKGGNNSYAEVEKANHPLIRLFNMKGATWTGKPYTKEETERLLGNEPFFTATWAASSPESAKEFSAVGYFFGRELNETQKVPVGLINNAVGGSPSESWTSREALSADPQLRPVLEGDWLDLINYDWCRNSAKQSLAPWYEEAAKAKAQGAAIPQRPGHVFAPTFLYEKDLLPLAPMAFRGVIWYQGESNDRDGFAYAKKFQTMIQCWRKLWGRDFPFLFVQLPDFGKDIQDRPRITYNERSWALVRESQRAALALPATGMAVAVGLGEPNNIHPTNKQDVGHRLALLARQQVYGEKVVTSPMYQSMKIDGDRIILSFSNVGNGLLAQDGILPSFVIAGTDKKFYLAEAAIEGETVVVRSDKVPAPVAVRYGWAANPECDLYNKPVAPARTGLPAAPFRTDDWALPTRFWRTDPDDKPADYNNTLILDNPQWTRWSFPK
ncbi:MAG: sialate O-acetylesterase [Verrucomicrobiae bacterium]